MSDESSKKPFSIGYGKPPEEHRFKPGQSGNPRGRPIKMGRSFTQRQTTRDILDITESTTRMRTSSGVRVVTIHEAMLRMIVQKGLEGHAASQRFVIKLHQQAVAEHEDRHRDYFEFVEMVEAEAVKKPVPVENMRSHQHFINDLRKKTRRN